MSILTHPHCFFIDDDEDEQELFQLAIREVDDTFTYVAVNDPLKALAILSNGSVIPKHIFLDVNMPAMSGDECLMELKKLPHLKEVPVYIYTTSASYDARQRYLLEGADRVLIKPCSLNEIVSLFKTLIREVA
jgi:CheY-like chemotaxis protein